MSPGFEQLPAVASDLKELASRAGIPRPFVLGGHGLGAIYARDYQRRYPQDVAGLILVDPMPEEDAEAAMFGKTVSLIDMADHDLAAWPVRPYARSRTSPPPQMPAAGRSAIGAPFDRLSRPAQAARVWAMDHLFGELNSLSAAQALAVMESERANFFEIYNSRHASELTIPVEVLTRAKDSTPEVSRMQNEIARISVNTRHETVEGSGTHIEVEQPRQVAAAIAHILKVVRERPAGD